MNFVGMEIPINGIVWIFFAIGMIFSLIAVFLYFFIDRLHPKANFKLYTARGILTRQLRVWKNIVPTDMDIIDLLFGKRPKGILMKYFSYEFFDGKKYFVGEYYQNHLFPIPFKLGETQFIIHECEKCKYSDRLDDKNITKCPKCGEQMVDNPLVLTNEFLQQLKYSPELEKRQIFTSTIERRSAMPIHEYVAIMDVGKKALEMMDTTSLETKTILDSNNPFVTALIASLPLSITLIVFAFGVFIMWQAMGDTLTKGAELLNSAADKFLIAKGGVP